MSNLKSKGIKAFIWNFLGKLANQSSGFIITILLARLLGPSDFGLIAMIMVVPSIAQVFTDVGLGAALIQRKRVLPIHYSSVFYFNITSAVILTCITFLSAEFIAEFYNNQELIPLTQTISFLFIFNALSSVQNIRLKKTLNFRLLTKVSFSSSLLSGAVGVTLAFCDAGVWSLVLQILSQSLFYNLLLWKSAGWLTEFTFSFRALMQLWAFGFRMFIIVLMDAVTSRADFIIIGKLFPVETLGYFQRAKSLNTLVTKYTSESLMAVLFPILSQIQYDLVRFSKVVIQCLNILSFLVFILIGVLYLSAEELTIFLFSDKWLPSVSYLELLILSSFALPLGALLVNVLSSRGNSKAFLKMAICKKIVFVINLMLAFNWGIEGYLKGMLITSLINTSITVYFSSREMCVHYSQLCKPIVLQMLISLTALFTTLYFSNLLSSSVLSIFIIKNSLFIIIFIILNVLFKTDSWRSVLQQSVPVYEKYCKKLSD